jgi:capsid assembly protease
MHDIILDTKQCFNNHMGVWAVEPNVFNAIYSSVQNGTIRIKSRTEMDAENQSSRDFQVYNGIAVVRILGTMMKAQSKFEFNSTSTIKLRQKIRSAVSDSKVKAILLYADSGGGHAAGTMELAEDILRARKQKRVFSYVEDVAASACYWAISQSEAIYSNRMANIGSIGTFVVLHDLSKKAEKEGIKVHVLSTGDYKGAGVAGTELKDDYIEYVQEIVNSTNEVFLEYVRESRGFTSESLVKIANGRLFMAAEAQKLGLIDDIMSFEEVLTKISMEVNAKRTDTAKKRLKLSSI